MNQDTYSRLKKIVEQLNNKERNMKKKAILLFVMSILLTCKISAQDNYKKYWKDLLNNNRKEAQQEFKKKHKNYQKKLELLLTNEILRNELGHINGTSPKFIEDLSSTKDFEYYMYALWNKPFLFDNYIKSGFFKNNYSNLQKISESKVENRTVRYALSYIKGVAARENKKIEEYRRKMDEIPMIKSWQFCGVFENLNKSGFDTEYPPEKIGQDTEVFNANSNGSIKWYTPHENKKREVYQFFSNHGEYGYGVNYAQTYITSNKSKRVQIRLGNSSAFKVWLNDVLIYQNQNDVSTDIDAYGIEVNLSKGVNRLLIKNAEGNGSSYFAARITEMDGTEAKDLSYSGSFIPYGKATLSKINPVIFTNEIEQFFLDKVKKNPNNFLYKYCLMLTYLRNQKYQKARLVLEPIMAKYEKSSFLKMIEINIYSYEKNFERVKEINKNIVLDDPNYYYSLLKKVMDFQELNRMDIGQLEVFLERLKKSVDHPLMHKVAQFMLDIRNEDYTNLRKTLDEMGKLASDKMTLLNKFIPLYDQLFQERKLAVSIFEEALSRKFNASLANSLIGYYEKQNEKDKVIKLREQYVSFFPSENTFLFSLIRKLHKYKRYKESIPYIEKALVNYPYSFKAMKFMGNALLQLEEKEKALKFYRKSLLYNNGDSELLKKIETLSREENYVDKYKIEDVYQYIEDTRNKNIKNNYGVNILLDNRIIQLYENGGLKNRSTFLYEITSETGVKDYKEYNLGLSGNYEIIKSEIVKKDKTVKPAERKGSSFVFNGLEVGDVILVEYETNVTSTGRFFKDFVDTYQFDSQNYCVRTNYTLIIPKTISFNYKVENGSIAHKKEELSKYDVHIWELIGAKELPSTEDYTPATYDYARMLHLSTIDSWSEIANWYSDLVRSQSLFDEEVRKKFKEIFPEKDVLSLSEEERAKRIYYYIMNNFNYSHVNFKQSGYIPQKPSKTISSKLGDCKDFSTLYTTMAREAGLKANLVLILTSDYGEKALILPSQDFNHCIVKVKLDGKDQFLELTNKNLPYKSLPSSLVNATGLEIPHYIKANERSEIFTLKDLDKTRAEMIVDVDVNIDENDTQKLEIKSKVKGDLSSYYFEVFTEDNYKNIKKNITEDFKNRIDHAIILDSISEIVAKKGFDHVTYNTKISIDNKLSKVGSMTIFKLPIVSHAYTEDIISLEERKYPIFYQNYENSDYYLSTYNITIPKGKKIVEVPENKKFTFKNHSYEIRYSLVKNNKLKVIIEAYTDSSLIYPEDYSSFKSHVKKILEVKNILIGYK